MNSELLFSDSSFSWLAKEIRRGQIHRKVGGVHRKTSGGNLRIVQTEKPKPLGITRLPVDFSADKAIFRAKHMRALYLGELFGGAARAAIEKIGKLLAWLNGNSQESERVKHFQELRKAA